MEQPAFLEKVAELLYERIQLGQNRLAVDKKDKEFWQRELQRLWDTGEQNQEDVKTRDESSANYTLVSQLTQLWTQLNQPDGGDIRLFALDAFFDFMEDKLRKAEKGIASKRIIHRTKLGILMIGSRPILGDMLLEDERIPMDAHRLYRRISLLPKLVVEDISELVDGSQYIFSAHKLSRPQLRIGLASLSGKARTHFEPTGELAPVGPLPRIGFKSLNIQPEFTYRQELQACIDWAVTEKIHILCLPELSVCGDGRQVLKTQLKQYGKARQLKDLALVIAGSYHTNNFNEAPVWLVDSDGDVSEFMYRKHEVFSTRVASKEQPQLGMEAVNAFAKQHDLLQKDFYHIQESIISDDSMLMIQLPIGLVGVLICKDFLSSNFYNQKYDALEPDYLFIVSMNRKGGEFMQMWQRGPKRHALSAGFYVNATQVVTDDDVDTEVVFWGLPDDHSKLDVRKTRVYYRRVDKPDTITEQLPVDGLVSILLASHAYNYDTSSLNLNQLNIP